MQWCTQLQSKCPNEEFNLYLDYQGGNSFTQQSVLLPLPITRQYRAIEHPRLACSRDSQLMPLPTVVLLGSHAVSITRPGSETLFFVLDTHCIWIRGWGACKQGFWLGTPLCKSLFLNSHILLDWRRCHSLSFRSLMVDIPRACLQPAFI